MFARIARQSLFAGLLATASPALGSFHLIGIHEIFSSTDGNIQFVELQMYVGGQTFVGGRQLRTLANGVTTNTFNIPNNVSNGALNARILFATPGYDALPNSPTPDFIVPGPFFDANATSVTFNFGLNVDILTIPGSSIPRDGITSLRDDTPGGSPTLTYGTNSPQNNAGTIGGIDIRPPAGDFNGDGQVDATDIDLMFATPQGTPTAAAARFDLTGDNVINSVPNTANSDADRWVRVIKATQYGDTTLDGNVNFDDLLALAQHYGNPSGSWADGDIDGVEGISFSDLLLMAQGYGFSPPQLRTGSFADDWALAQSMVPEPSSVLLVAGLVRRRRSTRP